MFGVLNDGLREFVQARWGDSLWQTICETLAIEPAGFLSLEPYPDSLTYHCVRLACQYSGMEENQLWRAFGENWFLTTLEQRFGELLKLGGQGIEGFLGNLGQLEARGALAFPQLAPPRFSVEHADPGIYRLHYCSKREGLEPFVAGILAGVGKRFGHELDITWTSSASQTEVSGTHAIFTLRLRAERTVGPLDGEDQGCEETRPS